MKDKARYRSNSLKLRGCFFAFVGSPAKVVTFTFIFFLLLVSAGLCRQELEYDSFSGTWSYVNKDSIDLSTGPTGEGLNYDSSTGKWVSVNKDLTPQNSQPPVNYDYFFNSNGELVSNASQTTITGKQKVTLPSPGSDLNILSSQQELSQPAVITKNSFK